MPIAIKYLSSFEPQEVIVAYRSTASDTLRVIRVELGREYTKGGPSAMHMMFAVVQTDWTWMAWYFFLVGRMAGDLPACRKSWEGEFLNDEYKGTEKAPHWSKVPQETKETRSWL
jgi:hypothetical protein